MQKIFKQLGQRRALTKFLESLLFMSYYVLVLYGVSTMHIQAIKQHRSNAYYLNLQQGWQTLSQSQMVNILGFQGHRISVSTTQCCLYSPKAAIDNTYAYIKGYGCILKKLYLQSGQPSNQGLPASGPGHCSQTCFTVEKFQIHHQCPEPTPSNLDLIIQG